eukprot:scaffold7866_cov100-Skeletonema_dohrnii-CCMP3373.AAC.4
MEVTGARTATAHPLLRTDSAHSFVEQHVDNYNRCPKDEPYTSPCSPIQADCVCHKWDGRNAWLGLSPCK